MNSPLAFFDSPFSVPESALSPTLADLANDIFGFDNFATAYVDYSEPFGQMSGPSTSFLPSDILSFATGHSDPTAQDLYSSEMSQYDDNQSWTPEGLSPFGPIMSYVFGPVLPCRSLTSRRQVIMGAPGVRSLSSLITLQHGCVQRAGELCSMPHVSLLTRAVALRHSSILRRPRVLVSFTESRTSIPIPLSGLSCLWIRGV